jgi:hypothetical protein
MDADSSWVSNVSWVGGGECVGGWHIIKGYVINHRLLIFIVVGIIMGMRI